MLLLFPALAACGGNTSSGKTVQVNVMLSDYKIQSSVTTFQPNTNYHFVIANSGKTVHEFMIMPNDMNMGGMKMEDMDKMALASVDQIAAGQTKTLDYTFTTSGSHPIFGCYLPGHYEAGMKLAVAVQ